jgi:hypothetical protein
MNTFKFRLLSVFILTSLLAALPGSYAQARSMIIRVKWDAPGPVHDGSSWEYAYTNLGAALAASREGTQIWVAQGTYKPTTGTDRDISFELQNNVGVYGGFVGIETMRDQRDPVTNVTILSGDIGVPDIMADNSYHVLRQKSFGLPLEYAELDGFTITYGNANESPHMSGGGLNLFGTSNTRIKLKNIIFKDNSAAWNGGGMSADSHKILMENVTFMNNKAARSGGGLAFGGGTDPSLDLRNVTFTNNTAYECGGGAYLNASAILSGVTFTGNKAAEMGGGLWFFDSQGGSLSVRYTTFSRNVAQAGGGLFIGDGSVTLTRVTFLGNKAVTQIGKGGGMFSSAANVTLDEVMFKGNTAASMGGGLYNLGTTTVSNSTFYANTTSASYAGGGAGIYNSVYYVGGVAVYPTLLVSNSTFHKNATGGVGGGIANDGVATISYSTFSHNSASQDGAGIRNSGEGSLNLNNSILANSTAGGDCINYANFSGDHNLIETNGTYNACGAPLLTSDPNLDLMRDNGGYAPTMALLPGSPAIDAGDDANCPARDQRGAGRPEGSHCDIGAYEAPPTVGVGPGMYDDTDPAWSYSGDWSTWSGSGPYNNTMHYTNATNATATFTFQAPAQFVLYFQASSNRSNILISVDGGAPVLVNAYSATDLWQQTYTSGMYSDTNSHTVTISTPGNGNYIDVDAIEIKEP